MTRYFTQEHEWIEADGEIATIGITDFAQQQLGDIVFVELPEPGVALARGAQAAVVESVKAASDVYSPIAGTVTESNPQLEGDPALVNSDAEGAGWFFRLTIADAGEMNGLMNQEQYAAFLENAA